MQNIMLLVHIIATSDANMVQLQCKNLREKLDITSYNKINAF